MDCDTEGCWTHATCQTVGCDEHGIAKHLTIAVGNDEVVTCGGCSQPCTVGP